MRTDKKKLFVGEGRNALLPSQSQSPAESKESIIKRTILTVYPVLWYSTWLTLRIPSLFCSRFHRIIVNFQTVITHGVMLPVIKGIFPVNDFFSTDIDALGTNQIRCSGRDESSEEFSKVAWQGITQTDSDVADNDLDRRMLYFCT